MGAVQVAVILVAARVIFDVPFVGAPGLLPGGVFLSVLTLVLPKAASRRSSATTLSPAAESVSISSAPVIPAPITSTSTSRSALSGG